MKELVIGIDFAGPARARDQRRKILAVAVERSAPGQYVISPHGLNQRLLASPPGWVASELADTLIHSEVPVSVVAPDFSFSIPAPLLSSSTFAALVGHPHAFGSWQAFNEFVASRLPLTSPVDYAPFARWRDKAHWLKRATDAAARAQPPLKDRFQVLFNMTLLGAAFLARLESSGRFDVLPFQKRGRAAVIEIYPGHAMRQWGVPHYKKAPGEAIDAALDHLKSQGIQLQLDPAVRRVCETYNTGHGANSDYDAADALVAACLAVLYREGRARQIPVEPPTTITVEGSIWGP